MLHTIKNEKICVQIDSVGAQLMSIKDKCGHEYIWQRNPKVWAKSAPILFPVVGRSRDGILNIYGKDYNMPCHGFVKERELEVIERKENEITLVLNPDEETKASYPYDFEFRIIFKAKDNRLTVSNIIINNDKKIMYCGCGGHPAFNLKLNEDDKFEDWFIEFEYDEPLWANDIDLDTVEISSDKKHEIKRDKNIVKLKRNLFDEDAMIFEELKSKSVKIKSEKHNNGAAVYFYDYPTLGIWSKGREVVDADYVCIEPWQSMGFRSDEGHKIEEKYQILKICPGEHKAFNYCIEVF